MNKNILKTIFLLMAGVSFSYNLAAINSNGDNSVKRDESDKVRYLENVFDNIAIKKDVVFGESITFTGIKQFLGLDIYTPENDMQQNRPVIVWIHGGGFRPGNDKTQSYIVEMAKRFTKKGYVCLSIDYRVRENPKDDPLATISDAEEDALKALTWLRKNGNDLKVDLSKIIVAGGSAGGRVACKLLYNDRPGNANDKNGIVALVDLWGTPDITWGELNVDKNDPPTIIVHGTEDKLVSYSYSVDLVKKLEANNVNHKLITYEGAGHTPVKYMDDFETKIAEFLYEIIK